LALPATRNTQKLTGVKKKGAISTWKGQQMVKLRGGSNLLAACGKVQRNVLGTVQGGGLGPQTRQKERQSSGELSKIESRRSEKPKELKGGEGKRGLSDYGTN